MAEDFSKIIDTFREKMEALASDVSKAASVIRELKRERDNLKAELEFLRVENQNARVIMAENEKLNKDRTWTLNHLEKILKKLQVLHV
jgi:SMC interacting uncharacterized protein involved in chromosome segregation